MFLFSSGVQRRNVYVQSPTQKCVWRRTPRSPVLRQNVILRPRSRANMLNMWYLLVDKCFVDLSLSIFSALSH